ncbi:sulfotransferase family protein [Flavobacteriaceae bacterium LMO-SS05]
MFFKEKFRINFIVIGVQKGGTTALDNYLRQNPNIEMGYIKEIHFFDNVKYFENKQTNYDIYHKNFNLQENGKIFGEVTPSYIFLEESIGRIKKYNPEIKLIAILRNPIDRAFSNWNMEIRRKNEKKSFLMCINEEINQISEDQLDLNIYSSYIKRGFYKRQIENIQKYFNRDQVLYIKYEDFFLRHTEELKKIYSFLEVETLETNIKKETVHKIEYVNNISLEEKSILYNIYKNDIQYVEKNIGWNCDDWKLKE